MTADKKTTWTPPPMVCTFGDSALLKQLLVGER